MPSDIPNIARVPHAPALVGAILVVAAALRAVLGVRRPLQVDEGYSLHLAALPVAQGLQAIATLDVHPPLFLLATHVLAALHVDDIWFRLIAVALGVASVAAFYGVVRAWHGERIALFAAAGAALMPSLLFYDTMIRMYAPFDALAIATFFILSLLYTRDDLSVLQRRALWCAWALASGAMIQTLYLGFMVIAAQLLYAALLRRDGLMRCLAGAAFACVAWLPQLPTFLHQLPRGGLAFPFYAQHQLAALFELPGQATIAVATHGAGSIVVAASIVAWLWIALVFGFGLRGNTRSLAIWMAVPALLTLAYSLIAHKLLYTDRYYLLFGYALCALTGICLARLMQANAVRAWAVCIAAGGMLAALACWYAFDAHLYTADWPSVETLLRSRMQPRDLIVMEQGSSYFVLERSPTLGRHPLILVFHPGDVAAAGRLARPFPRIWLVLFQAGPVDPNLALVAALENDHGVAGLWEFPRWLPAESSSVALFLGRATRRGNPRAPKR